MRKVLGMEVYEWLGFFEKYLKRSGLFTGRNVLVEALVGRVRDFGKR